jgi:PLP dependent protein
MTDTRLVPDEVEAFRRARHEVLESIAAACARAGRDPASVTLVAVSKTVAAPRVRAAVAAGFTVLGENRVQEGAAKIPEVPGARWHLIGPLQSNKARRAVELFDVVQAVHSLDLAVRLDALAAELRPGRPLPVLLQVNVDRDPAKAGFAPEEAEAAVAHAAGLVSLEVRGLMTIGRFGEGEAETRGTFVALRELAARLRAGGAQLGPELSMGMSDDYGWAVEEGATIVRVGRAIFGGRPATA